MQIQRDQIEPTKVKLTITAEQALLDTVKQAVLKRLSQNVKVQGFRSGKAPAHLIEKQLDQQLLQSEFLDAAVNQLYTEAVRQEKLRVVTQPTVSITKFVPFSTLEFTAEFEVVGDIKLADYKKIKLARKPVEVSAKDVDEVLENLRGRAAQKEVVTRAAKSGDEVTIDFKGVDAKTKEPIAGADGKDYALPLGSKTFIPGFEDELIGIKTGEERSFTLTFPKDYGAKELQSRKVNFTVTATKVQELKPPKLDDTFAATVGPFTSLSELKSDIKKQVTAERQREAQAAYDNELLEKIAAGSTVAIPKALVDEEVDRVEESEKRDVTYRGQTWQEHLDAEGLDAEAHREKQRPAAELRVKAGLILGEAAEKEQVSVTPEEVKLRVQLLKGQYPDPAMQAELDKPENQRDIRGRLLTEKTLDALRGYATQG
ncbi:MAG: trigger factor [Candidatus Saccharimonadales bacterium]